ncbi:MAG: hypothetical protein ACJA0V_004266 [Planctomycetota bacterium]|jgi:hypothetical protein
MFGLLSNTRHAVLGLASLVVVQTQLFAQAEQPVVEAVERAQNVQDPAAQDPEKQKAEQLAKIEQAAEKWLATDQTSEDMMAETVVTVLDDSKVGLAWLGKQLPAIDKAPNTSRSKGLRTLCTQTTLEFLRRTAKAEMVFVGQYNDLLALQPFASYFLFQLLLETPDWYPFTFRVRLVPALRDIQQRLPAIACVDGIVELIKNEREPEGLRHALAAMMAQWDRPEHANAVIKRLREATMEGDGEDRVGATLVLADYYNLLRDYKNAVSAHRTAQALAKGANVELRPIAWYAAACVHALAGNVDRGIEALERCARMHASPDLDRSLRLKRILFEKDPEIELLRSDKRFAALVKLAYGDDKLDKPQKDGR